MIKIQTTKKFDKWLDKLRDRRAIARIRTRLDQAERGNLGDSKPVGGGVLEMRIHYGPGYRLYYTRRGEDLIVMLAGGQKSNQQKDIEEAIQMAKENR